MVVCPTDHSLQADVVFVIEGTAVNGAYISDIKTNYIVPSLEFFSQGNVDENTSYISENANSLFGVVVYHAADCLPDLSSETYGPFSCPSKLLTAIDRLELIGGKAESHANIAEGLATALMCFEELQTKRGANITALKHCILICNSPPYMLPVMECQTYSGKTAEQLAGILQEKNINLSIISPRKIPSLYKLFEKAGGDLNTCQNKNYAKDPRHLVLLKGYSLKERPVSPPPGAVSTQSQIQNTNMALSTSLPSPLASNDSPSQQNPNMMGGNTTAAVTSGVNQNPIYRPTGGPQMPKMQQSMVPNAGMPCGVRIMNNPQIMQPTMQAPPGYPGQRSSPHWQMPPPTQQPRPPYMQPNQQVNTTQSGSALIAQLTQPPSSIPGTGVGQFSQMNSGSPINKMNMNQQPNVQTSMPQNTTMQTSMPQVSQSNQVATSQAQSTVQPSPQVGTVRERHTIWQGLLQWSDKNPPNQNITKLVPCQVSSNCKDGEPELKADSWPQKLIMQLMPKQLIGNIGGAYLKNSKSVLFHPTACEALESLTKIMSSGFAGCVHFTPNHPTCEIKVLILLYTADKRAYLGFIPNDQAAFVDRLKIVIQQQKSAHQMRQTGNGGPSLGQQQQPGGGPKPMGGTPPQLPGTNPTTSQQPQQQQQQGLLISQTNTLSMGGGQITQNVPPTGAGGGAGQSAQQPMGGLMGQGAGMRPNIRMQGMQQPGAPQQQITIQQQLGMMGTSAGVPRGPPFENQLEAERLQNLEKINQLKQTLEAAQQQEQQYKSQLERISHMKTSQIQQALHDAQQTEMQFKMLEQQRMANDGNPQAATAQQQQRMMRPVMANNPGLRHLLQQQPQYRQQLINMQQMGASGPRGQMGQQMPNAGTNQQATFDDVANFDFNNII